MKDYLDYMRSDTQYIEKFEKACDDLISSRYILAESKISVLLQTIAGNVELYKMFRSTLDGFDFDAAMAKSKIPSGYNTYKIVLPSDTKQIAAYVFRLLYAFDTGAMSLKDFLHEYFYSVAGANAEYELFAKYILMPFRDSVAKICDKKPSHLYGQDVDGDMQTIGSGLIEITHAMESDAKYAECAKLANAVADVLFSGDKKLLTALWIGFRNTLRLSKSYEEVRAKVELSERHLRALNMLTD